MKLRQVEFVLAIAREGSFSRAAAACNATQPSLSSALAQLEDELGGRLFARTTRRVELTAFGRHMLPTLEAVIGARDEATTAAAAFHDPEHKLLRIGLSPLVDMRMISLVTEPFRRQRRDIEIFYKECLLDDLGERLDAGAIDLVVLPRDIVPAGLDQLSFYADPLFYLPRGGEDLGSAGPLVVRDMPDAPIIMTGGGCGLNRSLELLFEAEGAAPPSYSGYAMSYPVIQEWTWLGIGAGVLPGAKLTDRGSERPLLLGSGTRASFEFLWAWRRDAHDIAHVADFIAHLRKRVAALVSGHEASAVS